MGDRLKFRSPRDRANTNNNRNTAPKESQKPGDKEAKGSIRTTQKSARQHIVSIEEDRFRNNARYTTNTMVNARWTGKPPPAINP
jgi:hypothetical protein